MKMVWGYRIINNMTLYNNLGVFTVQIVKGNGSSEKYVWK